MDTSGILQSLRKTKRLLVTEEVCSIGSVGRRLLYEAESAGICLEQYRLLDLDGGLVPHGDTRQLWKRFGLDAASVARTAAELCGKAEGQA